MKSRWCDNCIRLRPVRQGRCIHCDQRMHGASSTAFSARSVLVTATLLFFGWLYYQPYHVVDRLGEALRTQDATLLAQTIDFPAVRRSLKQQYGAWLQARPTQAADNPFADAALFIAVRLFESRVDNALTPSALATMAGQSWPVDISVSGLADARLGYESPALFTVSLPGETGEETRLIMTRKGLSWQIRRIELPRHTMNTGIK